MQFDLITIFPDIFTSYFSKGMIRIAQEKKKIKCNFHNLRNFAVDKHGTVDDRPFGGGPGQVFMVEPIIKALKKIRRKKKSKIILLSAKGKTWNQQLAQKYSEQEQLIFICPRYEGIDERIKKFIDEEISIGNYVLTGGELGAMVIIDSVTRLLPGVLGKQESLNEESHSTAGYLEYPQYTRPETLIVNKKKLNVPKVLLSGHHQKIKGWREKHSKRSKK